MKLSATKARWERFAYEIVKDWNIGKAYLRAGYKCKPTSASRSGLRLLSTNVHIQEIVGELVEKQKKAAEKDAAAIIKELEQLGFSNIKDYLSFDKKGVEFKNSSELTPEQLAAIAEVSEYETKGGTRHIRFKLHDKKGSLELLGRRFGIFPTREVQSKDTGPLKPFKVTLDE